MFYKLGWDDLSGNAWSGIMKAPIFYSSRYLDIIPIRKPLTLIVEGRTLVCHKRTLSAAWPLY